MAAAALRRDRQTAAPVLRLRFPWSFIDPGRDHKELDSTATLHFLDCGMARVGNARPRPDISVKGSEDHGALRGRRGARDIHPHDGGQAVESLVATGDRRRQAGGEALYCD